jgi:chaperonin cofactor prefoldin
MSLSQPPFRLLSSLFTLRTEISKLNASRQQLETQHLENQSVKKASFYKVVPEDIRLVHCLRPHLHTFLPSYLLTFLPSYLLIYLPSYLLTFSPFHLLTISSSYHFTFLPFHLLIFSSSHLLTFSPSSPSSHLLSFPPSYHLHFFTFFTFSPSSPSSPSHLDVPPTSQELDLADDEDTVFKLIGPALVKQDLEEARSNVEKRIEYISQEM